MTVSEGRFDGAANNQTSDDQHATGTTITADSDPVVDVRLTLRAKSWMGSGKAITHNGETLTWQEVAGSNGHSFQAVTASGTLVLTVTLPERAGAHRSPYPGNPRLPGDGTPTWITGRMTSST